LLQTWMMVGYRIRRKSQMANTSTRA
jgi:hypothetical protein